MDPISSSTQGSLGTQQVTQHKPPIKKNTDAAQASASDATTAAQNNPPQNTSATPSAAAQVAAQLAQQLAARQAARQAANAQDDSGAGNSKPAPTNATPSSSQQTQANNNPKQQAVAQYQSSQALLQADQQRTSPHLSAKA